MSWVPKDEEMMSWLPGFYRAHGGSWFVMVPLMTGFIPYASYN